MQVRIGFCGTGKMATAITLGLLNSGHSAAVDLLGYNPDATLAQEFSGQTQVRNTGDLAELVQFSDLIIIAVKPDTVAQVLGEIAALDTANAPVLVSIAAGVKLAALREACGASYGGALVRVMPNLNVTVGAGMSAVCAESGPDAAAATAVLEIFNSVGEAVVLAEKDFPAFTAIAGSSPAYTFLFIDSLARAAVKRGMPKDQATRIAAQAVLGSARQVQESVLSPWDLIDAVSSPGGTTVAGLVALEDRGFISTVIAGVEATVERSLELGDG